MLKPPRSLIVFLVVVTLARLCAAAFIPLGEDEAYYRLWAAHLQWGYYDHPPMIAWWVRAGMVLAGDNPLGVRLLPVLASGLTGLIVFDIAGRIGASARAAWRAAIWFNATLLIGVGGILAIPDAPNILFWALTIACLTRIEGPRGFGWWLAAGFFAGLATLSKYSALFIAPGVLLWLVLKPGGWRALLKPGPWGAALIACGLFGLNVAWNADHHWVTFIKQFGRAAPTGFAPMNLVWFVAVQLVLLNPYITWFTGEAVAANWRPAKTSPAVDLGLPLYLCVPFVAYLLLHSLHDRVEAHWTAPLYPALVILGACAAESVATTGYMNGVRRRATTVGLAVSTVALAHLALPVTDIGPGDPAMGFRGWSDLASRIERLRLAHNAAWVGTLSYGTTAELAAAHAIHAPIVELRERDRYSQGDPQGAADFTRPGLVVDLDYRVTGARLGDCFTAVAPLGEQIRGDSARAGIGYTVVLATGAKSADGDCGAPK